ncbi:MAG: UDP-3-O-(3-hydroxymyristoyl)glucosamine N-acyltransferase [Gemmatimonadetes bacterium]|nr:UDP-3-O-(3-hydroxymyristoyl)glucosamine N-acyltransferase [Gemmatimonadota bacterium]
MPELSISEVARLVGGEVAGDGERRVSGVGTLEAAGPADLSFVANSRYLPYVQATSAAALLVPRSLAGQLPEGVTQVRVGDPHAALAAVLPVLYPEPQVPAGVHPTAVIGEGTTLGEGVSVGAYAVVGRDARIGDRARIGAQAVIGDGCAVGADSVVHAHVTLYRGVEVGARCTLHSGVRLGADGFGFAFVDGEHRKVPQVGGCRIEDDVEIGANTTIDRGSVGDTVVGRGTKIDNLVQIGHNCRIGRHVIIVSQVGISGSTTVGDYAVLGGQAGVQGHIRIGARAKVGGQAGVIADIPDGATVSGYPARPHREALRAQAAFFRLPELMDKIRRLEQKVFGREGQDDS